MKFLLNFIKTEDLVNEINERSKWHTNIVKLGRINFIDMGNNIYKKL